MTSSILAIDLGASKTGAVQAQKIKEQWVISREVVFGSGDLYTQGELNEQTLAAIFKRLSQEFSQAPKAIVALGLTSQAFQLQLNQYSLADPRQQKAIAEDRKKLQKDSGKFYLRAFPGSPNPTQTKLYYPYLATREFLKLPRALKAQGWQLKKIIFTPQVYEKYISQPNYILLNLGARTTELVFWCQGGLQARSLLPVGGEHVVQDLIQVCKIPPHEAREKLFHSTQLFRTFLENEKDDLAQQVIDARVKEIFQLIQQEISTVFGTRKVERKIFLTGGLAYLPRLDQYLQEYLGWPAIKLSELILASWPSEIKKPSREALTAALLLEHFISNEG